MHQSNNNLIIIKKCVLGIYFRYFNISFLTLYCIINLYILLHSPRTKSSKFIFVKININKQFSFLTSLFFIFIIFSSFLTNIF